MARRTVIKHPDGTTTEVTTSTSLGRGCSAVGWFVLAVFVAFAPAAWWGWWSVPAYVALAMMAVAAVVQRRNAANCTTSTPRGRRGGAR